jgi:hypothetical protein
MSPENKQQTQLDQRKTLPILTSRPEKQAEKPDKIGLEPFCRNRYKIALTEANFAQTIVAIVGNCVSSKDNSAGS